MNISLQYVDHMGSDLTVVNAARTSFSKESDWEYTGPEGSETVTLGRQLKAADQNLIRYLATGYRTKDWDEFLLHVKHSVLSGDTKALEELLFLHRTKATHWAPFAHPQLSIRMTIPLFLARQLVKHNVGSVWSEESRRYISDTPDFYIPEELHNRPKDIKQGSGSRVYYETQALQILNEATEDSVYQYRKLLKLDVAPEEARMVLPLNSMSTIVLTGSLAFWVRVYLQRSDLHKDSQLLAQDFAKKLNDIIQPLFPVSWRYLTQP